MSQIKPVKTLKEAKYSFDTARSAWFRGRKSVSEEDVLIFNAVFNFLIFSGTFGIFSCKSAQRICRFF